MAQLDQLQNRLLEMLRFFHAFCEANHLRYYIIGGTLLGALRHQGFIPWDDDVDIGMPRSDYDAFLRLFGTTAIDRYAVESASSDDENFCFPYAKLFDTSTTLIENTKKPLKRGIYLDIFPLDGAGNSLREAMLHFAAIDGKKTLLSMRMTKISNRRAGYKNAILRIVQALPACMICEKNLSRQIDALCRQKDFDGCALVGNLTGAWGKKEIVPRELFGMPRLYRFEDLSVYGLERPEAYLAHIYGDWQKLPPESKRVSHHNYYLDLNSSYL